MNRLKDLREDKDMLQKEIASIINIPIDILKKIALTYNTSTDYILGLTNEFKPYPRNKEFNIIQKN